MTPTLVIMAAGIGSRYGGLKQIDPVGPSGEIVLDYSVYDAIQAGFGKVVFIIRPDIEEAFKEVIGTKLDGRIQVEYVFQTLEDILRAGRVGEQTGSGQWKDRVEFVFKRQFELPDDPDIRQQCVARLLKSFN